MRRFITRRSLGSWGRLGLLTLFCALVPTTLVSCGGNGLVFRAILTAGISLFFEGPSGGYAPVDPAFLSIPITTPAPPMVLLPGQRAERYVFAGGDLLSPVHVEGTASGTPGMALRISLELRRSDEADFSPLPGVEATIDPAVDGPEISIDLPGFDQVPSIEPGDVLRLVLEAIGNQGQITFSDDLKKRMIQATIGDLLDRTQSLVLAQNAQSQGVFGSAPRVATAGSGYGPLVLAAGETNLPYQYRATDLRTFSVGANGAAPDRITCTYEGPVCFSLLARSQGAQTTFEVALLVRDSQGGALQGIQLSSFAGPFTVGSQAERFEGGFEALPPQIIVETTSGTDAIPAPFELVVRVAAGSDPLELVFDPQDETRRSTVSIPGPNVVLHYPGQVDVPITQPTRDFAQIEPRCSAITSAQSQVTSGGSGTGSGAATVPAALLVSLAQPRVSESAGPGGLLITLSRTGDTSQSLEVSLTSSDPTALQVPRTVTIPAGSRQIGVALDPIDDILLDGDQAATITALAPGFRGAFETVSVTDDDLAVVPDTPTLLEGGQVQVAITRAETQGDLTVNLSLSAPTQATAPTQITIADGQATGRLTVQGTADGLLDGDQPVTLRTSATSYAPQDVVLTVVDRDLHLTLSASTIAETNGSATGTASRTGTTGALTVALASSDPQQATVPPAVTIPDGSSQATFQLSAVPDTLLDGPAAVRITGRAAGYAVRAAAITVEDDDLGVTMGAREIPENGGRTTLTVRRAASAGDLSLSLSSSDRTEATVAATALIPDGQQQVVIPVLAVDDAVVDGDQSVRISAVAPGFLAASATVTVTDDDLSLAPAASTVPEGSRVQVAINRGATQGDLIVTLSASDPAQASVASRVTIADGQATGTFTVGGIKDGRLDGDQVVTVRATAPGYAPQDVALTIQDRDLHLTASTATIAETGGRATVTAKRTGTAGAVTVTLASSDPQQATVPRAVTIPAGSDQASFQVDAVPDTLLDGPAAVRITGQAVGYTVRSAALTVEDDDLGLTLATREISESGGRTTLTVRRGASAGALALALTSSDRTEATVAATATIADGQRQVVIPVIARDDAVLDGAQAVTLTARSTGFQAARIVIRVLDNDLSLTLRDATVSEGAGARATRGTIRRGDRTGALRVSLRSSRPQDATVPAQVTIPNGSTSVGFDVAAVANQVVDGTRTLSISASAPGFANVGARLSVTDDETLGLQAGATSVAENATTGVALTITRSNVGQAQTVQLTSSDPTRLTVPASVVIPTGQARLQVSATPVDNQTADGNAQVVVTVRAAGLPDAQATIDVIDDEQPALQVTLPVRSVVENAAPIRATVRRNTPTSAALRVTLRSGLRTAATVPASVTIPAGAASATFMVTPTDNRLLDGRRTARLTASATGHATGAVSLGVSDNEPGAIARRSTLTRSSQGPPPANGTTNVPIILVLQDAVGVFAGETVELTVSPASALIQRTTGQTDAAGRFRTKIGAYAPGPVTVQARVVSQSAGTFALQSSLRIDLVDLLATPRKIRLPRPATASINPAPVSVAAGDFLAKDGFADLAVAAAGTSEVVTYRGDGQGGLAQSVRLQSIKEPKAVEISALVSGGPTKLILAQSGLVRTYQDAGSGGGVDLSPQLSLPSRNPRTLGLGLIDRDQAADIVVADAAGAAFFASGMQYGSDRVITGPQIGDAAVVRRRDVAVSLPQTGEVQVLRYVAGTGFQVVGRVTVGAGVTDLLAVDVDGDGEPELVAVQPQSDALFVMRWDGASLKLMARLNTGKGPVAVEAADLNSDGLVDLCVVNQRSQSLSLFLGDGKGAFQTLSVQASTGNVPTDLAIADLNQDGAPDVIVSDQQDGTLSIFFGRP